MAGVTPARDSPTFLAQLVFYSASISAALGTSPERTYLRREHGAHTKARRGRIEKLSQQQLDLEMKILDDGERRNGPTRPHRLGANQEGEDQRPPMAATTAP